jgi:hypothetical protein
MPVAYWITGARQSGITHAGVENENTKFLTGTSVPLDLLANGRPKTRLENAIGVA